MALDPTRVFSTDRSIAPCDRVVGVSGAWLKQQLGLADSANFADVEGTLQRGFPAAMLAPCPGAGPLPIYFSGRWYMNSELEGAIASNYTPSPNTKFVAGALVLGGLFWWMGRRRSSGLRGLRRRR